MGLMQKLSSWKSARPGLWWSAVIAVSILVLGGALVVGYLAAVLVNNSTLSEVGSILSWLLATNTTQVTWYVTRAAGLVAYLLLWLSTVWGLAVSSRVLEGKLHGSYTYDFHQYISLLGIGFLGLHMLMLLFDKYLPYSVGQVLVPLLSTYRPVWVAIGILSMYVTLLVTVTFYIRDRIGQKAFRVIHVFSLLGFLGAAVHGLLAGTDGPLPVVRLMYALTVLSVVFLTVYWASLMLQKRMEQKRAARLAQSQSAHKHMRPIYK
jgi:sulfoxide reductase heme-binding subunit YedZ